MIVIPGASMVILGTLAVLFAAAAGIAVTDFVGILLVSADLFRIATAVREDDWQSTVFRFPTGAVAGVAGDWLLTGSLVSLLLAGDFWRGPSSHCGRCPASRRLGC